jgi:translation elongation factor EF-Tu-like GTPase
VVGLGIVERAVMHHHHLVVIVGIHAEPLGAAINLMRRNDKKAPSGPTSGTVRRSVLCAVLFSRAINST